MKIPKGTSLNPNGRPKGIPNKATTNAREAITEFVNGNVDRLTGWLDAIAETDPKEAFKAYMSVVEYNIPKLARHENKISGDLNVYTKIERVIVDPKD